MITIDNLTKYYGKHLAVNNISFTINDNEILGFLGPNGAGKSTTMNMIAGYLPMSKGKINVLGNDISKAPAAAKKCIGYLPEIPPVYPDMKVHEYLKFCAGLKSVPISKRKQQVEYVMERLKVTDVQNRLIKNLSKGYKQRVGFAQALLGDPKFLILDEPTVGLDPNQVVEVREIIRELKKDHSVIFSSHILSEISAVCDRVVIINKGEVKAIDTIENLESSFNSNLVLNIQIDGNKESISNVISDVEGVDKIIEVQPVKGSINVYRVALNGDSDKIRNLIMSALIKNNYTILEIFTEKPNLEDVFVKLINQPTKRDSLHDLLESLGSDDKDADNPDNPYNNVPKEDK